MSNDKPAPKRDGLPISKLIITKPGGFEIKGLEGHTIIEAFRRDDNPGARNKHDIDIQFIPALGCYVVAVDSVSHGKKRYLLPREHVLGILED